MLFSHLVSLPVFIIAPMRLRVLVERHALHQAIPYPFCPPDVAVNRDDPLASPLTLCRLENRVDQSAAWAFHQVLIEQFIASYEKAPRRLILDFDATDDSVHGHQEGRFFHGYYDHYCFLPLYVFCNKQLLVSCLRPSNIDGAKHSWAILALLVKRLRQAWPKVRITFRADSGFCRWRMLRWCEDHGVDYIVGIAKNARLLHAVSDTATQVSERFARTGRRTRRFETFFYQVQSWDRARRVIAKLEHNDKGANPRFVVTSYTEKAPRLYQRYCARGEMENRIKEQQLGLFADRTSCHYWWANQCRLLLASFAYVLLDALRRIVLKGTELVQAQVGTLRLKLLTIGAVIMRNTRRIRILMSSAYPYQQLFHTIVARLVPG